MHRNSILAVLCAASLSGCIVPATTPDVVVQEADKKQSSFTQRDTILVNKPYEHVSAILTKKSEECLHRKVTSYTYAGTDQGRNHFLQDVVALTPKITVKGGKTRLTLQSLYVSGTQELGTPPPDGWYYMVVDAFPAGGRQTRVEMYYQKNGSSYYIVYPAVKRWLEEKDMRCPDFANSNSEDKTDSARQGS